MASSKLITVTAGGLSCRVLDDGSGKTPELLCVLCHGYGAPGSDLVGLGAEVLHLLPRLAGRVRFAFPEAPLSLDGAPFGGRAWWHLDMTRLERAMRSRDPGTLTDETPDGLPDARKKLRALLDELLRVHKLPTARLVLGGFSQGAMLATDVALHLEEAPAALVEMSGTVISKPEWVKRLPGRRGLRVLVSHGRQDAVLPFSIADAWQQELSAAGLVVDWVPFSGGHTIDASTLETLAALLDDALPKLPG